MNTASHNVPLSSSSSSSHSVMSPAAATNPLGELINTEKVYIDTLKIIDIELAPLLQHSSALFEELLDSTHDIVVSNTRFYQRLSRIAANPQMARELGDLLVQWVDDMQAPYTNFCQEFAAVERGDLLTKSDPPIERILQKHSVRTNRDVTLHTLFSAPIQQLQYYKSLYSRFLQNAEPGRSDHRLLIKTNERIDAIIAIMQPQPQPTATAVLQDEDNSDDVLSGIDCSGAIDLFSGAPKPYLVSSSQRLGRVVMKDRFVLLPEGAHLSAPARLQAILTSEVLVLVDDATNKLLYAPMAVGELMTNSRDLDRELVGEYVVQVTVQAKKHLTLRADTKETRNKWVGVRGNAPSSTTLTPRPMRTIIAQHGVATPRIDTSARKSVVRTRDVFSFYQDQSGEISPLSSDDDNDSDSGIATRNLGGGNTRPKVPPLPISRIDEKHEVPATGAPTAINKATAQLMTPRPSPSSDSETGSRGNSPVRPTVPRTIEISHAVAPVAAMQAAITQTNDYFVPGAQQHARLPPPPHPPVKQSTWPAPGAPSIAANRSPSPGPPTGGASSRQHQPQHLQPGNVPVSQQQQPQPPPLRSQRSMPELASAPRHHPGPMPQHQHQQQQPPNGKVLCSNRSSCQVFRWKAESWYGVDGECLVQVRQVSTHRLCLSIQMQHSGQLYLNAWVLPSTAINHASPTDVSVTVHMALAKETYLIHFHAPQDASALYQALMHAHQLALAANFIVDKNSNTNNDDDDDQATKQAQQPQTERLVMQCKAKLFVQNEHAKWGSLGSGLVLRLAQQSPSKKMYIDIEDGKKKKLISAMVQSRNVAQIGPKRISLLFITDKQHVVYMVQVKEEQTATKLYDYLRTRNSENGW